MKRILLLLAILLLAFPSIARASPIGAAVAEADGDPSGWAYKFVFPNGTVAILNGVATYTDSVEIPNGNNPTTDAAGEIALDVNNVALEVFAATASRLIPTVYTKELTIPEPDKQQAILDAWPIFRVDATAFPFGITVTSCYITLSADAAYVAVFEEWTGDPPAQTADIETVTTGAGDSYMEDTTPANPTIEADNYVYVDLPTTDVPMVQVQISYTVNEGN